MLILAGVSLNAIIGDNGIITNAQTANMKNSIAVLEEFLQQKYVENFERFNNDDSKVVQLQGMYPEYFYIPANQHIGSLRYIVDSDGKALYLINKEGLPSYIKDQLIGGNTGSGAYSDYANLIDVYGVTSDLKVYYCENGKESIIGVDAENLDKDNPLRTALSMESNNNLYSIVSSYDKDNNGKISAEEVKSIDSLTINSISNFNDFFNFPNLKTLYFENATIDNFDGIENCPLLYYISFSSCTATNYSSIGKLGEKLTTLYFYDIDDAEIEKICNKIVGIGNYDLPQLSKVAFSGTKNNISSCSLYNTSYVSGDLENYYTSSKTGIKSITRLTDLKNLTKTTQKAVKYLSVGCNAITSLDGLEGFDSLYLLRAERNNLSNLDGIGNCKNLNFLNVPYNSLQKLTTFVEGTNLYELSIAKNENLTSLDGLDNCFRLAYLYARDCNLGNSLDKNDKSSEMDSLYSLRNISTLTWVDFRNNLDIHWIEYLQGNTNMTYIRLTDCTTINKTSIAKIKKQIQNAGSNAYIPSMYSMALLDSNTKVLDLGNQEMFIDDFEVIQTYTKLEKLSLKNVKIFIKNEDDTKTEITASTETTINQEFIDVLSALTSMTALQLYGCKYLSTISFVTNMNSLKELDIRETNVTDLSILETKRTNDTMRLGCLCVNKVGTNLKLIPKTIDGLYTYASGYWTHVDNAADGGLLCTSRTVFETLKESNITKLKTHYSATSEGYMVDLTDCSNLERVRLAGSGSKLKLPSCIKRIEGVNYSMPTLVSNTKLNYIQIFGAPNWDIALKGLACVTSVDEIDAGFVSGQIDLNFLNEISVKKVSIKKSGKDGAVNFSGLILPSTLETFSFKSYTGEGINSAINIPSSILSASGTALTSFILNNTNISNFTFLNNLTRLTYIDLRKNAMTNISFSGEQLTSLNKLYLANNKISALKGIDTFKTITLLEINYNLLTDRSAYEDENGNTIGYNNLEEILKIKSGKRRAINTTLDFE